MYLVLKVDGNQILECKEVNKMRIHELKFLYVDWSFSKSKVHKFHCFDFYELHKMDSNKLR